jgi:glycosyltransferase involved in cell wall biosynthesis/ADP-heptose:LPS heptosyltransferase
VSAEDEEAFCSQLIRSPALLAYLAENRKRYDAVVLLPYLYGLVIEGVHVAAQRSLLQPCLHDEAYAYLPTVARAIYSASRLLFLSEGERELAVRLYGPGIIAKSMVSGAGVDVADVEPDDSLLARLEAARFVLCLGRKDPGKKTDFLAECFSRYKREHPRSRLQLVLAGTGQVSLPRDCPGLVEFGAVSDAQKRSLLRHCAALFHPSENESYSRVIMEAWLEGRPAAASARCLATAFAVSEGHGGWLASTAEEWISLFAAIDRAGDAELAAIGEKGRTHAAQIASWDGVVGRYESAIASLALERDAARADASIESGAVAIHQMLPNVAMGDAISNHALWVQRALRRLGHPSEIYAIGIDSRLAAQVRRIAEYRDSPGHALIYHHSIGSEITPAAIAHRGPKCLIYHNITPHEYLEPYLPLHTHLCRKGREELPRLAIHFPVSVGDSNFNAIELAEVGFQSPGVLPICVDPAKWQLVPDAGLMERLQDGRTNVLFVGRLSPQKKQEDLIAAFARLLKRDASARLLLVGTSVTGDDLYLKCLEELCGELGVRHAVEFAGHVTDEQLVAYYRTAHLFWSMSEHEGFCVPLVEAMWFDTPVLAYDGSAISETLGGAGRVFATKDPEQVAAEASELLRDDTERRRVLDGQRARRTAFLEAPVSRSLEGLVSRMLKSSTLAAKTPAPSAAPPEIDPASVRRIAVVKLDHIGDLLLASPVFESLQARFPQAAITAVVAPKSAEVLLHNPHVSEIVHYDAPWFWREIPAQDRLRQVVAANAASLKRLGERHFDLVVNLRSDLANVLLASSVPHTHLLSYTNDSHYAFLITHPLTRTRGMHICEQHRDLLRVVGADFWREPVLYPSERDRRTVAESCRPAPGTVAVFAGAGIPLKCWAPVKFRELVRRLTADRIPVAFVGSAADFEAASEIAQGSGAKNLCGRFSLLELAAFLEECAVLVTNDSAPMHIAAAVGTTVVQITRPVVAEEFAPVGAQHLTCCAVSCDTPCSGFDAEARDAMPDFCRCIQSVGVDEVESKVWDAIGTYTIRSAVEAAPQRGSNASIERQHEVQYVEHSGRA